MVSSTVVAVTSLVVVVASFWVIVATTLTSLVVVNVLSRAVSKPAEGTERLRTEQVVSPWSVGRRSNPQDQRSFPL
jgi:hypothetical protein